MSLNRSVRSRYLAKVAITTPTLLAVAYFVLWACAPAASFPAAVPSLPGQSNHLGIGASYSQTRNLDNTSTAHLIDAQLWYYRKLGQRFELGATAFGGFTTLAGAGLMARYRFVEQENFVLGLEAQAGWLWGSVGVPVALRVGDRVWLYTNPSIAFLRSGLVRIPAGLAVKPAANFIFSAELGVNLVDLSDEYFGIAYVPIYGGLATSWQF